MCAARGALPGRPRITEVDGTGTPDGADGHTSSHLTDTLVVRGENLAGAQVELRPAGGGEALALSPYEGSSDNELTAPLPEGVNAGGFLLAVINALGEAATAELTLLQGEPGVCSLDRISSGSVPMRSGDELISSPLYIAAGNKVGVGVRDAGAMLSVQGSLAEALTGTLVLTAGSAAVDGVETKFTSELCVGAALKIGTEVYAVASITDDVNLTLDRAVPQSENGVTAFRDAKLFVLKDGAGVSRFSVDRSGNVAVSGDLEVAGNVVARKNLTVTGRAFFGEMEIFRKWGNNGSVSCDEYCRDPDGRWLPRWPGAPAEGRGACLGGYDYVYKKYYDCFTVAGGKDKNIHCFCLANHHAMN